MISEQATSGGCRHPRVSHGGGAVYECLDCGESVPLHLQAAMGAVESPAGEALRTALLAWQEPPCDHPRVSQKAYAFYGRGPAPLLAHQCLSCGEPVSAEDAVRVRTSRAGAEVS